jgi:D-serine deaminase-like pyridoxal phosphate-dependent protein
MIRLEPTHCRLGESHSRFELNTPALVLDLDAFERNVERMAATIAGFGRSLRPHAKSHKCSRIARAQIEAGALGICCATLDEAEAMAEAGLRGIMITSPVTTAGKIGRLIMLLRRAPDTMIVADNPDNVAALAQAARQVGVVLAVLVDVELGFGRTGVLTVDAAEALAHQIASEAGLSFAGLQAYGGHLQHTADYETRLRLTRQAATFVTQIVDRLGKIGLTPLRVSGSGTGTHAIDGRSGPFTEIQAGSYVFMDADYEAVNYGEGKEWPFEVSLFVQTAVISTNIAGTASTDAGTKAFALNGPKPRIAMGPLIGATYDFSGDEHGRIRLASGMAAPRIGDRLECVVSHCDPTVALYDVYHCVRGDVLVDVWSIDARTRRAACPSSYIRGV